MPSIVRGSIYLCDYGPISGRELSDCRPALVVSNTAFNDHFPSVLTFPMTRGRSSARHLRNHVPVESVDSYASVRQIKAVEKGRLRDWEGEATPLEMERALESLAARLVISRIRPAISEIPSESGQLRVGTTWYVEVRNPDGAVRSVHTLILDYNAANGVAIAVDVDDSSGSKSRVKVPITTIDSNEQWSALIHRVRSVDVVESARDKVGEVDATSLIAVKSALFSVISQ